MNLIATSLQLGMSVLQSAMGNPSFLWQGQLVRCLPAAITDANSVIAGGFQDNVQVRLLVKLADWRLADSTLVTVDASVWSCDVGSNADRLLQENGSLILQENTDGNCGLCLLDEMGPVRITFWTWEPKPNDPNRRRRYNPLFRCLERIPPEN